MEPLVTKGLTKSIGVSNFNGQQLSEILKINKIPCVMNQIENHPFLDQKELIDLCKSNDVMVTSYSPLGAPDRPTRKLGVNDIQISVANDAETFQVNSLIKEIAKARGCSASQLLIAYNLNQGMACIPKSSNPIRMEENYKALKVSLTDDDIRRMDTLACNFKAYPFKLWENHIHYPFTTSHKESPASS
ncbi:putative aldose reductase [Apostichopus japonicus]|nr:putative aldose reductase [Apostichopus japonicus]